MTSAVHARGTKLAYGDGASPELFTTVAEQLSVTFPEQTRGEIEVTNHDSTVGQKEFIADDLDQGTAQCEVNFLNHASHTAVQTKADSGVVGNWKLTFSNGWVWVFPAYVQSFGGDAPATGSQLKATFNLRVTGAITRTPPA